MGLEVNVVWYHFKECKVLISTSGVHDMCIDRDCSVEYTFMYVVRPSRVHLFIFLCTWRVVTLVWSTGNKLIHVPKIFGAYALAYITCTCKYI